MESHHCLEDQEINDLECALRRPFHIKISCIGIVWGKLLRNANLCDHMNRKETATETIPVIMRNKMIKKKA